MILVLPGMGADNRMYQGSWRDRPDFEFIDWPIKVYPEKIRYLAEIIGDLIECDPTALIGSSLGGMVALELADILEISHVALIGSAVSCDEIQPALKHLAPLSTIAPLELVQVFAGKSDALLADMYSKTSPEFIRKMIKAAVSWNYPGEIRPFRIHGSHDRVIRCDQPDVSINGGHLLAMTHPQECVEAIAKWIDESVTPSSTP